MGYTVLLRMRLFDEKLSDLFPQRCLGPSMILRPWNLSHYVCFKGLPISNTVPGELSKSLAIDYAINNDFLL